MSQVEITCPYCQHEYEKEVEEIGTQEINCINCEAELKVDIECLFYADVHEDKTKEEFEAKKKIALEWINERDAEMFVIQSGEFFYCDSDFGAGIIKNINQATKFKTMESLEHAKKLMESRGIKDYKIIKLKDALKGIK